MLSRYFPKALIPPSAFAVILHCCYSATAQIGTERYKTNENYRKEIKHYSCRSYSFWGGSSLALAANHSASMTGSTAKSVGKVIYSYDTAADSKFTRANWTVKGASGGVTNRSGSGSVASRNTGHDIKAVQACRSRTALPMICTSWNNNY